MLRTALTHACAFAVACVASAAQPPPADSLDFAAEFDAEVVGQGFNNPCGLTIRNASPATGRHELYFSESGAGRIVMSETDKPEEIATVITGFPTGEWKMGPGFQMGPMGTLLLTGGALAVGYGGDERGDAAIRVYRIDERQADAPPIAFDEFDQQVAPSPADDAEPDVGVQLFSLSKNDYALLAAAGGNSAADYLLKATIMRNQLADLQPLVNARGQTGVARPMATAISPKGYLVVGQAGETDDVRDSVVAFYAPGSGELVDVFAAGLHDVVALAYSPDSGNLYAVDAAWHDPGAGGVYRLDAAVVDGRQTVQPVKIAQCVGPTSLAFTPAGGLLFVTAFGPEGDQRDGRLIKITGAF